jgi:hypothetical protein
VLSLEHHNDPDYSAYEKYSPDFVVLEGPPNILSTYGLQSELEDPNKKESLSWAARTSMNRPILLVDPWAGLVEEVKHHVKEFAYTGLTRVGFGIAFLSVLNRLRPGKKISRRGLLAGLAAVVAGDFISPRMISAFNNRKGEIDETSLWWELDAWMNKNAAPVIVDARNAIIAEKLEAIAPSLRQRLGKKPLIIIQIGAGHSGIASYLRQPESRREAIRELSPKIKKEMYPTYTDSVIEFRWDPQKKKASWKTMEVPISKMIGLANPFRRFRPSHLLHSLPPKTQVALSRREFFRRMVRPTARKRA